jgi:hypothetical protein
MSYSFRPATREDVSLLIGLAGGTGSGKTFSALRLATGMAAGQKFAVIDTENGRARHYADQFTFDVADLRAPFRPDAYAEAIEAADAAGYPVIVVDSMSHEHAGDGGLLDWHEDEYTRLGGNDKVKMTAWIKPKMAHKAMVSRLLQVKAHVILCFRAEEKIEIGKDAAGKTVIKPKVSLTGLDGWIPISEKNLPYELTLSVLLTADHPGYPKPIKLQEQHKAFVPLDQPISEDTGTRLAGWAAGTAAGTAGRAGVAEAPLGVAPAEPLINHEQRKRLGELAKKNSISPDEASEIILAYAGVVSSADIPASLFEVVRDAFSNVEVPT